MEPKVCCVGRRGLQQAVSLSLAGCVGSARGCSDGAVRGRRSGHGFCNFIASVGIHSAGRGFNDFVAGALRKSFPTGRILSSPMVQWLFHQTGALGLKGSEHQRVALLKSSRALYSAQTGLAQTMSKCPRRKQLIVRCAQRLIKAGPSEVQSAMTPRKQFSTAGRPRQGQLPWPL